jgi:hypothetical protein
MGGSGDGDVSSTRLMLARMLGQLAHYIVQPLDSVETAAATSTGTTAAPIDLFVRVLMVHLGSRSALQRTVTSLVIANWPHHLPQQQQQQNEISLKTEEQKVRIVL